MASNKELIQAIAAISADVDTSGMNNAQLAAKLKELKDAITAQPKVAEGKSVTSKRGILGPGAAVCAGDLAGGKAAFDDLVEKGYIA